ncbi:transferase [Aureococcus anophagefferens]|nr:transferase [Aureococcus anophagefferens]
METQAVGAESISLDVVKRVFAAFDVDLAETRNERTNELLASMMAGLLSGEGSIPADLVRRALAAYEVDLAVKKPFFSEKTGRRFTWTLLQKASTWDGDVSMVKARSSRDSAWRYMDRVQAAGGYDQLVRTYRRVLTAPRSCLVKYLEFRFGRPAPADLVPSVLEFWKPPGGG